MSSSSSSVEGSSIHAGVDDLIDHTLEVTEIGRPPHYDTIRAARKLTETKLDESQIVELVGKIYDLIKTNHEMAPLRDPSRENWRFREASNVHPDNSSPEKSLESAIARIGGSSWVSQVPTASGLVGSYERHRNVDLVHKFEDDSYEFVELKWESNNPLFAAFEILKNGLVYLYSRRRRDDLRYTQPDNPLLWGVSVDLVVLAPASYYARLNLAWLERAIGAGMKALLDESADTGLVMCFRFEQFPDSFRWGRDPAADGVRWACDDEELERAVKDRVPVTWVDASQLA